MATATAVVKDPGPATLGLQPVQYVDCTTIIPAQASTLIRGLHPSAVCFHQEKPLMAVSTSGYVAIYDLISGSRTGRLDLQSSAVAMCFSPEGSQLLVVVEDWILYGITLATWQSKVLVPRRTKMDKPLESCLLAVAPGPAPRIYFCRYAKDVVRLAHVVRPATRDAKGNIRKDGKEASQSTWGTKLKLDTAKPILGLATHHVDQQLYVLHADGMLRGYAPSQTAVDGLTPLWAVKVQDAPDRGLPALGTLEVVPHPLLPSGAVILQASRLGTVSVLEQASAEAPSPLLQNRMQGWGATLGMGTHKDSQLLLVFGLTDSGRVRPGAWRMSGKQGVPGLTLTPLKVEPLDLLPLMDGLTQARAATAATAGKAAIATPGAEKVAAGGKAGSWQAMWAPTPAWAVEAPSSVLLDVSMSPLVERMLVHPALGCVAAVLEPPFAVQSSEALTYQRVATLTAEEQLLARRTATIPVLGLTNHELPLQGWPGACATPLHTSVNTWRAAVSSSGTTESIFGIGGGGVFANGGAVSGASLSLPPHVYYLQENRLVKHSLVTGRSAQLAPLPTYMDDGGTRLARLLTFSAIQGCWLVSFEGVGASDLSGERWTWALINGSSWEATAAAVGRANTAGTGNPMVHIKPGKHATFFGPHDDFIAVMEPAGRAVAVFDTTAAAASDCPPLYTISPDAATLFPGSSIASPLFAGPPSLVAPLPEELQLVADDTAAAAVEDGSGFDDEGNRIGGPKQPQGAGVLMWQSADGYLAMATLPIGALGSKGYREPDLAAKNNQKSTGGSRRTSKSGVRKAAAGVLNAVKAVVAKPFGRASRGYDADVSSEDDTEDDTAPAEDVEDEGEEAQQAAGPYMPTGRHLGPLHRQAGLPLKRGEHVLQVCWQPLAPGRPSAPEHCAAAVLTTMRVLIVSGDLKPHACLTLADHTTSVTHPITSLLWVGPALLISTADGKVQHFAWDGSLHTLATVAPNSRTTLLAATADSLLLLRCAAAGGAALAGVEVVARPVSLLQPLLLGWASLASTWQLGPAGLADTRSVLRSLLASFDTTQVTPSLLWSLLHACSFDIASALAEHCLQLDPEVRLATAAAAGRWAAVAAALASEHQRSLYHPSPPPAGSALHCKLVAGAAGAVMHGQMGRAMEMLTRAGEWRGVLVLALCHGNLSAAQTASQAMAAAAASATAPAGSAAADRYNSEAAEAAKLAHALRSLYDGAGGHTHDLTLSMVDADGAPVTDAASSWQLGSYGECGPPAVAVAGSLPPQALTDGETGRIPTASRSSLLPYLALASGSISLASSATAAISYAIDVDADASSVTGGLDGAPASSMSQAQSVNLMDLERSSIGSSTTTTTTTALDPQAAARAEFLGLGGNDALDSSDDDSSMCSGMGGGASETAASRKFKIQIRSRDDAPAAAAAASSLSLKEAAKVLKVLPGPPSSSSGAGSGFGASGAFGSGGGFGAASAGVTGSDSRGRLGGGGRSVGGGVTLDPPIISLGGGSISPALMGGLSGGNVSPALMGGVGKGPGTGADSAQPLLNTSSNLISQLSGTPSMSAPSSGSMQFAPGVSVSSAALFQQGVSLMEQANWHDAASTFGRAMSVLAMEPSSSNTSQRMAYCAQYYAAVRLLAVGSQGTAGTREARLYRYASALKLDDRHQTALVRESIARNKAVGNHKYAADQLTTLITRFLGTAPMEAMAAMQADIDACDRAGGRNIDIPGDEDVDTFASLVASCTTQADVNLLVGPLLQAA